VLGVIMTQYLVNFLNLFIGLRKTVIMLALLLVSIIFRIKGLITPDNFSDLLKATTLGFFASNSIEHYTTMIKDQLNSKGEKVQVTEIDTNTEEG
jgi:hypothetical protein